MRRALFALVCILVISGSAAAQTTTTFNGIVKDLTQTPVPTGQVSFQLRPGLDTTISGNARFTSTTVFCEIHNPSVVSTSGTGTITVVVGTAQTWQAGDSILFIGTADATLNGNTVATPYTITLVNSTTSFNFTQSGTHTNGAGGTVGGLYATGGTGGCKVTQNTAITPANTSYNVGLWPLFSLTSSFNTYAIGSGPVDISTVVPTPGQMPAYSFIDAFSNQTVGGNKTFTGANSSSGAWTFSGALNANGGGALNGSFSGPTTLSGGVTATSGPNAFNCKNFENVRCIDPSNSAGWNAAPNCTTDIGTCISGAYTDCPTTGCRIKVAAGAYSETTQPSLAVVGKFALVECDPGGASIITYTPTTGAALTLDYGNTLAVDHGVRDCEFRGPGSGTSTVGIQVGVTNGASGAVIHGGKLGKASAGFGVGIQLESVGQLAFATTLEDSHVFNNGTCISHPAGEEGNRILNSILAQCGTGLSAVGGGNDVQIFGTSFDDNTTTAISVTSGAATCYGCHFENVGLGTSQYATISGGTLTLFGGILQDDVTSGTQTQFITGTGACNIIIYGTKLFSLGRTVTSAVNLGGSCNADLHFSNVTPSLISLQYNTAYTNGRILDCPLRSDTTYVACRFVNFTQPDIFSGPAGAPSGLVDIRGAGGNIVGGVTGSLLNWGQNAVGWNMAMDTSGNMGINGRFNAGSNVTASGAVCTNGELALSAGWQSTGSATVTAVAGNGQTCSWTITTGTTTAANPTVTDTLTNALPNATTVCEMNIHGGTHTAAAGEGFQQTTLSATAPVFTFNGTPTAGNTTYFVTRRCGP